MCSMNTLEECIPGAPFAKHGSILILAYIHYKVWDDIVYPFRNFSSASIAEG